MNENFLRSELNLYDKLKDIDYGPRVEYVHFPVGYASQVHSDFLTRYLTGPKKVLYLGLNPGPWGMMQNGIPFGEANSVREFLKVEGVVGPAGPTHPNRPVLGLNCKRSEVSGKRFWDFARLMGSDSPESFFAHSFVHNYFPLCLIDGRGKNVTPPELKDLEIGVRETIESACDESLIEVIRLLEVETIVAIGRYVEDKVRKLSKKSSLALKVVYLPHPSPRNPTSNKNWIQTAQKVIIDNDLSRFYTS